MYRYTPLTPDDNDACCDEERGLLLVPLEQLRSSLLFHVPFALLRVRDPGPRSSIPLSPGKAKATGSIAGTSASGGSTSWTWLRPDADDSLAASSTEGTGQTQRPRRQARHDKGASRESCVCFSMHGRPRQNHQQYCPSRCLVEPVVISMPQECWKSMAHGCSIWQKNRLGMMATPNIWVRYEVDHCICLRKYHGGRQPLSRMILLWAKQGECALVFQQGHLLLTLNETVQF